MTDDIVHRLRAIYPEISQISQWPVRYDAADEIERLRVELEHYVESHQTMVDEIERLRDENAMLREALTPFASRADDYAAQFPPEFYIDECMFTVGDLIAARAALEKTK